MNDTLSGFIGLIVGCGLGIIIGIVIWSCSIDTAIKTGVYFNMEKVYSFKLIKEPRLVDVESGKEKT